MSAWLSCIHVGGRATASPNIGMGAQAPFKISKGSGWKRIGKKGQRHAHFARCIYANRASNPRYSYNQAIACSSSTHSTFAGENEHGLITCMQCRIIILDLLYLNYLPTPLLLPAMMGSCILPNSQTAQLPNRETGYYCNRWYTRRCMHCSHTFAGEQELSRVSPLIS